MEAKLEFILKKYKKGTPKGNGNDCQSLALLL